MSDRRGGWEELQGALEAFETPSAATPPVEAVPAAAVPAAEPEPASAQPVTLEPGQTWEQAAEAVHPTVPDRDEAMEAAQTADEQPAAARDDGRNLEEEVIVQPATEPDWLADIQSLPEDAIPAPEVLDVPVPLAEPAVPAEEADEQPGIAWGPGMAPETARAIREQQRLAHESEREGRAVEFSSCVEAVQQFAQRFEHDVYGTGEAFRAERAMAATELPPAAVQALRQAEAAYQQVSRANRGRVPESVQNALMHTRTELAHQAAARQARERLAVLQRETRGATLIGTDKPLQKEMRGVLASLRQLGNYGEIRNEIAQLRTLRDNKLAKSPAAVDRRIAELAALQRAHESVDGLLAWKGLDANLRKAIAAVHAGRRLDFGDTSKHPVDALRQRFYNGVVVLLMPPQSQTRGEAPVPTAPIPAPERAGGVRPPQATEEIEDKGERAEASDPVSRLRRSGRPDPEVADLHALVGRDVPKGKGEPEEVAKFYGELHAVVAEDKKKGAVRDAHHLVSTLINAMKTMGPEQQQHTAEWINAFVANLVTQGHGETFNTPLMQAAIDQAAHILHRRSPRIPGS